MALFAAAALTTSSLAATKAKVQPAPPPAPYAGAYQPQGVDEIGLWRQDDEVERKLALSPLVIRDEAAVRDSLRRVLSAHGYRTVEAANGSEASA